MIDPANGTIQFEKPALAITAEFTATDYARSPLAKLTGALPGTRFSFQPVQLLGELFAGSVVFRSGILQSIHLAVIKAEFGTGWSDWSEEKELARKRLHETLLESALGRPLRVLVAHPTEERSSLRGERFVWGEILSLYDPRAGCSTVSVNYTVEEIAK